MAAAGEHRGERVAGRGQQQLPGVRDSAAHDEPVRIQNHGEVGETLAEPTPDLLEAVHGCRVVLLRGSHHGSAVDRVDVAGDLPESLALIRTLRRDLLCSAHECGATAVLLPATVVAAATPPATGHDPHVPGLARDAERAAIEPVVDDDAATEAGADGDDDDVLGADACAEAVLPPGGGVGVVLDDDGKGELLGDLIAKGGVAPSEVGREQHRLAISIDPARRADADARDLVFGEQLADDLADDVDKVRRVARRRTAPGAGEHVAVVVDHAGGDLGAADVYADGECHRRLPVASSSRSMCSTPPLTPPCWCDSTTVRAAAASAAVASMRCANVSGRACRMSVSSWQTGQSRHSGEPVAMGTSSPWPRAHSVSASMRRAASSPSAPGAVVTGGSTGRGRAGTALAARRREAPRRRRRSGGERSEGRAHDGTTRP